LQFRPHKHYCSQASSTNSALECESERSIKDLIKTVASLSAVELPAKIAPDALSHRAVFSQQLFLRMLSIERRRSERSGKRLVLMLLDAPALLRNDQAPAFGEVVLSLSESTRDTDLVGWYKNGSVLGVLFTEIGASVRPIADLLRQKVEGALHAAIPVPQLPDIKLSFHVFPDDCQGKSARNQAFSIFYADLVQRMDSGAASRAAKRCVDAAGSLVLIALLFPLMVMIALAVKLTSKGPVLFRQHRLGQFGQAFSFLKFRSMYAQTDDTIHKEYAKKFISNQASTGGDAESQQVYKLKCDPRITKVGGFLRRTSLDEIPQLLNVLSGRMSLVGPRPPLPYEFEAYEAWHMGRLAVKPGLTGIWQVEGRSRVRFDDMVRMDLRYVKAWSLSLDLRILLRTPRAVLGGDGAY
jgi:lipopolysaccharide/colanic/teichoic acid biosynthesis glycosyltransferase